VQVKARYYCGNCSREVSSNSSTCPYCGSSFTAVRCPKCSYEGRPAEFRDGCPACGYMMSQDVRVPVMPTVKKSQPQNLMSRRFYRVAGLVLLVLFAVLIVLLLIKP
jgi:DNA-directed RNA polymerase subunit RPC12/RpoP